MTDFIFHLRKIILGRDSDSLSDGQLLERFILDRDEIAFEALVRRHGPTVLRVCRHLVGDEHDAEDAFQATFLVLARKAETVDPRDRVGNWLCGVAFRTGQAARAARLRRLTRERQLADLPHPAVCSPGDPDILPLLDRELNRLPEKFRLPIILCGVEGRGRKEVAAQLSLPEGTLASRLDAARRLLAKRLARYGVAISVAATVLALPKDGLALLPSQLVAATVQTAMRSAPAAVLALARGVLQASLWLRLKIAAGIVVFTLAGFGGFAGWRANHPELLPLQRIERLNSSEQHLKQQLAMTPVAHHELTDQERLQGVWDVVLFERDGETVPMAARTRRHLVFVEDDKVMTHVLRVQEGHSFVTVTVRLDTTTNPKTIEVLHGGGRLWEGIYLLEEDTMKVCFVPAGHKLPTSFETTANAPPMLVILKRDGSMVWDMAKWQRAVQEQS